MPSVQEFQTRGRLRHAGFWLRLLAVLPVALWLVIRVREHLGVCRRRARATNKGWLRRSFFILDIRANLRRESRYSGSDLPWMQTRFNAESRPPEADARKIGSADSVSQASAAPGDRWESPRPIVKDEVRARKTTVLASLFALAGAFLTANLHAASVLSVSPQGNTRDVRQVAVRFDADMVPLGQSDGAEPASMQCTPQTPAGRARWIGPRAWAFEFTSEVRGGTHCDVIFKPDLKTLAGETVTPPAPTSFVAGPSGFFASFPPEGSEVAPDQVFLMRHYDPQPADDPQAMAAMAADFVCEQRDGDKVVREPAVPVLGAALADAIHAAPPGNYALALRCGQPLSEGVQLRLSQSGASSADARRFNYITRARFAARMACTVLGYPVGDKACDPRQPLFLEFSGNVAPGVARDVSLVSATGQTLAFELVPQRQRSDVRRLRLLPSNGGFGEGARYTVRIPENLRDGLGRPLVNASEFPKTVEFARLPPYLGAANRSAVMPWRPGGPDAMATFAVRHVERSLPLQQWRLGGEMGEGIESDAIALLQGQQSGQSPTGQLLNTKAGAPRASTMETRGGDMEFVGVPLSRPGLHVVRADSAAFAQYIGTRLPNSNQRREAAPLERYDLVQVTNLNPSASISDYGASVIWVTAFDTAKPVPGADVAVYSCNRELLWRGRTDAQGLAWPNESLRGKLACSDNARAAAPRFSSGSNNPWVVVRAGDDMAVMQVIGGWWGVVAPTFAPPNVRAHTVLDRTLFKAGETVSMQHVVRLLESRGFALPPPGILDVEIRNGRRDIVNNTSVPLGSDGSASEQWTIPADARLGDYTVSVSQRGRELTRTRFQVEEFRSPVFDSELHTKAKWEREAQFAVIDAHLSFFSGGSAANLPVTLQQGWSREVQAPLPGYRFYTELTGATPAVSSAPPAIAPQVAKLDAAGGAQIRLKAPPLERPMLLRTELKFEDPNGETQTVGTDTMLWPDRMKLGLRLREGDGDSPLAIEGIALDDNNRPVAGEPITVRVRAVRSLLTGGPYLTDHDPETDLCSTETDAQGQWSCEWRPPEPTDDNERNGLWLFDASAASLKHSRSVVHTAITQSRWMLEVQKDQARSALALENGPSFAPGETALIVARPERLPATLLLTTEREGVIAAGVYSIGTMGQRIELPIAAQHAPNVHLTGRYVYPLLGAGKDESIASTQRASVPVSPEAWTLSVGVRPKAAVARPRAPVPIEVEVRSAAGQPMADARVTLAVVDRSLLALKPNDTWSLAKAMLARRGDAVTASALDTQLLRSVERGPRPKYRPNDEVDRGAFGAVPAPALVASVSAAPPEGPNEIQTRSNDASLLLWRTDLRTDAQGIARITVPLNDALTQFRVVAIASAGEGQFGQGEATITSSQPLQIFSGLPEVLRADDVIVQKLSLRNAGAAPLTVLLKAEATVEPDAEWPGARDVVPMGAMAARGLKIERRVRLAVGQTQEILWPVAVPADAGTLRWRIEALGGKEHDALEVVQRVVPALAVTVRQSTVLSVADVGVMPVVQPRDAVPLTGGVRVALQSSLADAAVAGSERWMAQYPYGCLEQQSSRFVALDDRAGWDALMAGLPRYIDDKGLARYFPETSLPGSEMLTVQLLDLSYAMDWPIPEVQRNRMLDALDALLHGRLAMQDWAPRNGLEPQQLAAQATLAEHGRTKIAVQPKALDALSAQSLVDWLRTLMTMPADAERDAALKEAEAQLRSRFDVQGTLLRWRDESAMNWWWFMWSGDSTAARMALLAQRLAETDAGWKADAPLITRGLVGRQIAGHWSTTTGNVWSTLALRGFQRQSEAGPVDGVTRVTFGGITRKAVWADAKAPDELLPWPAQGASGTLQLRHEGNGKPWAIVSTLAAVANTQTVANGLRVRRTVTPVEQKREGQWSVGDVYHVRLELESTAEQTWVVVRDAVPSGASQLGRGLGRESKLAQADERHERNEQGERWIQPSYVERKSDSWLAYFRRVPRGTWLVEYTVRLNNAGEFKLPPVRAEAMYAPEIFGEGTAQAIKVQSR